MSLKFQRKKEDFVCEVCGTTTHGTGYTDHCPKCLWSKHVDINPGDRKAGCRGLMEPMGLTTKDGTRRISYKCTQCGYTFNVKVAEQDNTSEIQKLAAIPLLS